MTIKIYVPLNIGDTVQVGDEFYHYGDNQWICSTWIGTRLTSKDCAYRRPIVPGEGYVFVEIGDCLKLGDEYYDKGEWYLSSCSKIDNDTCRLETKHNMLYRRKKIVKPVKPVIDPGEGYVLVEDGDCVRPGDEYLGHNNKWFLSRCADFCCPDKVRQGQTLVYRRKTAIALLREVIDLREQNKIYKDKVDELLRYYAKYNAIEEICNKN